MGVIHWYPGFAAMLAAAVFGRGLLNVPTGIRNAALRGALIGSVTLVLFAPLFSIIYVLTHSTEHWDVFGLAAIILIGSAIVIWWLVAVLGAAVWRAFSIGSANRSFSPT
jgi:hypothetical protein